MSTWTWLTEPLPLDSANTRRWADGSHAEFLKTPTDLVAWLRAARPRLPRHTVVVPESFDADDLRAFHQVRDVLVDIFTPLSEDRAAPPSALARLTDLCLERPLVHVLDQHGPTWAAPKGLSPMDQLLGLIAAESVSLISSSADRIAVCHAPGCHWLYRQARPNQSWCHPECGNRARVSRHQRRHSAMAAHDLPDKD